MAFFLVAGVWGAVLAVALYHAFATLRPNARPPAIVILFTSPLLGPLRVNLHAVWPLMLLQAQLAGSKVLWARGLEWVFG